jgi:hypothetical protein
MGDLHHTDKVQLYFNCPEKAEHILKLFKETNYSDLVLIVMVDHLDGDWSIRDYVRPKKDDGIRPVYFLHGREIKGVHILVFLPSNIRIGNCWLKSPTLQVCLGRPNCWSKWGNKSIILKAEEENEERYIREEEEEKEARSENATLFYQRLMRLSLEPYLFI